MKKHEFFQVALLVVGPPLERPKFHPANVRFQDWLRWKDKFYALMRQHGYNPLLKTRPVKHGHGLHMTLGTDMIAEYQEWWKAQEWDAMCREAGVDGYVPRWKK